jgi:hypothetical protein
VKYLLLVLLLSACVNPTDYSQFSASRPPKLIYTQMQLIVLERPDDLKPDVNGTATILDFPDGQRMCVVNLRKYPQCLLHEIRHCTEGRWHDPAVPNDEDC